MSKNVILVGNPNTGKTTLFNTLTKSREKVANWHGVTVGIKSKTIKVSEDKFVVYDIPGLYSLNGYSNEEKIASDFLQKNKDAIIVNVCDANNFERNLILTKELISVGLNVIVVLNMAKEVRDFNYQMAEAELGVKIIPIDARRRIDALKLINEIKNIKIKKPQIIANITKNQLINAKNNKNLLKFNILNNKNNYKITDKIDKFVLNKWLFLVLFISSIFLVFYATFGPIGEAFSSIINVLFNYIFNILRKIILCINISDVIKMFLIDGVILSIESVLSFVPQILLLMFFLNLLEDTGFMSRVAFMFDGVLKKFGLTGKSLFGLFLGYGCTTSAVIATRNLENKSLRKRTILLLPFMSCSAKLPIFLVVSSLFFDNYKYLFIFGLYVFALIISIICSTIYKRFIPDRDNIFMLELPKYRLPNIKKVLINSLSVLYEFLVKIGTLILFFSIIVWILRNFSFNLHFLYGQNFSQSLLYFLSDKLSFLFKPIGLNNSSMIAILLLGIVAKEMIVVSIAMINGVGSSVAILRESLLSSSSLVSFDMTSSTVFLVFILIYSPCISALIAIKNEMGHKTALYIFVFQFLLAYIIAFFVFKLLTDFRFIFAILLFLFLDILLLVVLRLGKIKKCWRNCDACRRI